MSKELNKKLGSADIIWKLEDLYTGTEDPQLDADLKHCLEAAVHLKEQYSGKFEALEPGNLLTLVHGLEELSVVLGRIATHAFLNFTTQTGDAKAGAHLQKVREAGSQVGKETIFFELEWNALPEDKVIALLAAKELAPFQHYLESMRRYAPHLLSQTEEKLLMEISPVGRGAWNLLFEKVMGHLKFGELQRTEEEVLSDLYSQERQIRKEAATEMTEGLESQLHVLTHICNTLLADKMIGDRLRNYPNWLSSMNLSNELTGETVKVLVDTVTSRYDICQRYYRLKKKMLGLDELFDYDRYAPLPNLPDNLVGWDECQNLVHKAFANFSPEMAEIAKDFFTKGWIHAPIMEGKRGGAFAHPCTPDRHPYVMVNYTGNLRDISTVAHELGHGVHQVLAAKQGYFNSDTPLVLAETASVFAELLLFNHQLEMLEDPKNRKAFIGQKLESIFATVFRQVAMNRFEDLTHEGRRNQGELPVETLSQYWRQTQEAMFGDSVTLTENYGIWWSYIPHFLNSPGYVYSYAFGELLVLSLYAIYKEQGQDFVQNYMELLSAGGSKSPEALLKAFDIDLNQPEFWQGGLKIIEEMLDLFEE